MMEIGKIYERSETNWTPSVIASAADGSVTLLARDVTPHGTTVRYESPANKNTIGIRKTKQ